MGFRPQKDSGAARGMVAKLRINFLVIFFIVKAALSMSNEDAPSGELGFKYSVNHQNYNMIAICVVYR